MYGNPRACAALAPWSEFFTNQEYSTAVVVYTAASDATDEVQLLLMVLL
jgi:hypothetical protein